MKAYIIIPTHNEAKNIGPLIAEILNTVPGAQVVVVDEKSSDGTGPLARMMQSQHPDFVQVLHSQLMREAYVAGFRLALAQGATHILTMDADFTHSPASLPKLLGEDADVVIGSRYVRGARIRKWRFIPRFRMGKLTRFARKTLALSVRDPFSALRLYRREVLENFPFEELRTDHLAFQVELLSRLLAGGATVREIPIPFDARKQDPSKLSAWQSEEVRLSIRTLCRPT